jgi:hypothetical protein
MRYGQVLQHDLFVKETNSKYTFIKDKIGNSVVNKYPFIALQNYEISSLYSL